MGFCKPGTHKTIKPRGKRLRRREKILFGAAISRAPAPHPGLLPETEGDIFAAHRRRGHAGWRREMRLGDWDGRNPRWVWRGFLDRTFLKWRFYNEATRQRRNPALCLGSLVVENGPLPSSVKSSPSACPPSSPPEAATAKEESHGWRRVVAIQVLEEWKPEGRRGPSPSLAAARQVPALLSGICVHWRPSAVKNRNLSVLNGLAPRATPERVGGERWCRS